MSRHHRAQKWTNVNKGLRAIIAKTLPAPCLACGYPVLPGTKWHAGHIIDAMDGGQPIPSNVGPIHAYCNLSSGGKRGRAIQTGRKREADGMPDW